MEGYTRICLSSPTGKQRGGNTMAFPLKTPLTIKENTTAEVLIPIFVARKKREKPGFLITSNVCTYQSCGQRSEQLLGVVNSREGIEVTSTAPVKSGYYTEILIRIWNLDFSPVAIGEDIHSFTLLLEWGFPPDGKSIGGGVCSASSAKRKSLYHPSGEYYEFEESH